MIMLLPELGSVNLHLEEYMDGKKWTDGISRSREITNKRSKILHRG